MFSKSKLILRTTSRIVLSKSSIVSKLSPLILRSSGIATSVLKRSRDVPFDPILDILFEEYLKEEKETETGSKMLTKDPPLTSLDLDGKPIEPIDINPWLDDNELKYLMSDSSYERNKVIGSEEVHGDLNRNIFQNLCDVKQNDLDLENKNTPEDKGQVKNVIKEDTHKKDE